MIILKSIRITVGSVKDRGMIVTVNKNTKYPVVKVVWLDSETHDSWKTEDEITQDSGPMECFTVGFLVRKPTKKTPTYFVANTVTNPAPDIQRQASCIMKIPEVCVTEVVYLEDVY